MSSASGTGVYAKFIDKPILREDGRLVYAMVNAFALGGYPVTLFETTDFRELGPPGGLVYSIEGVTVTRTEPKNTENMIYVFDAQDSACARRKWKRKIRVGFDVFSNYAWASCRGREPVVMPYPMHPWNYGADLNVRLASARGREKKVRIFFSGDTKGYKRNRILYPRPKLTRTQVVDTILQGTGSQTLFVQDQATLDDVLQGQYKQRCVIVDMSKVFVEDWLNNLAKAEFFVCPPGYVMPMCHNTVEAMAVGAIPIINYPEWFRPSLKHLETCIAFDDERDLIAKIEHVLRMEAGDVARMRENVIEYYKRHLDPAVFIREIEARNDEELTVLMITDGCVVQSAAKLNAKSILIRDGPLEPGGIVGKAMYSLFGGGRRG